jgi:hypothetical protein
VYQCLQKSVEACLRVRTKPTREHANVPHGLGLLRARRERPHDWQPAERGYQFPPSNVGCHATPTGDAMQWRDDNTLGSAALRDFKPAYVGSGSFTTDAVKAAWSSMSALPLKADIASLPRYVRLVPRTETEAPTREELGAAPARHWA